MKKVSKPLVLVDDDISNDTVECLETLLAQARAGEVIGIAFAAILKKRAYIVNAAGEAHRSPTYSRGMLQALDDKLAGHVRGRTAWRPA